MSRSEEGVITISDSPEDDDDDDAAPLGPTPRWLYDEGAATAPDRRAASRALPPDAASTAGAAFPLSDASLQRDHPAPLLLPDDPAPAADAGVPGGTPGSQASSCVICMEQLGERGPHRAACLK